MLTDECVPFAVVDVETTGFSPKSDRVVEIAIVRLTETGEVDEEYCTLVNPERDVGPTDVHGIAASDVVSAPRFAEIVGDIVSRLRGAVLVGHNVRFDLGFLTGEVERLGWTLPQMPTLCTLGLTRHLGLDLPRRKLSHCCEHAGIPLHDHHSAAADAMAAARLLIHYLGLARRNGQTKLRQLGVETASAEGVWPACSPSGRRVLRGEAARAPSQDGLRMRRLLERLELPMDTDRGIEAYFDVLDRALEDRQVGEDEADRLYEVARIWSLTPADAIRAHKRYLRAVIDAALVDGVISDTEERDGLRVTELLGLPREAFDEARQEAQGSCATASQLIASTTAGKASALVGKTICFTGALLGKLNGQRLTRPVAESMVSAAGLVVKDTVTRGLDLLVVADPATQSAKAKRAREYGTRLLVEAELWRILNAPVSVG